MIDFSQAVAKFATTAGSKIDKTVYNSTVRLFNDVVNKTPVGDDWPKLFSPVTMTADIRAYYPDGDYVGGRLKGNWQASINQPIADETYQLDADGSRTKAAIAANVPLKAGHVVYLSNNVPYAYVIEFMGHSWQKAPRGMARIAMENAISVVKEEASRV